MYQVGINKRIILRRTANQVSRLKVVVCKQNRSSITYNYVKNNKYLYAKNDIAATITSSIPIVQPTRCTCYLTFVILGKRSTCFGLSINHQELKTAYTAKVYVKQLLLPAAIGDEIKLNSISSPIAAVWHIPLLYRQIWAPDDGRNDRPKHIERFTRVANLR
jgi:hypothetical protein